MEVAITVARKKYQLSSTKKEVSTQKSQRRSLKKEVSTKYTDSWVRKGHSSKIQIFGRHRFVFVCVRDRGGDGGRDCVQE